MIVLLLFVLAGWIYWQRRQLQRERDESQAIINALAEGVIAVDAEMRVRYINAVGAHMLGVARGQKLPEGGTQALEKSRTLLVACQEKSRVLSDSILIEDHSKIYLDFIAIPTKQGALVVLQDRSSDHKVLEMGRDFVANASHELRTPITIIRGFAETLQDLSELPPDMMIDITEKIVRNCQRMDTLVKNLLTLADLENLPESRFQECDLVALVEACIEVVKSVYRDAQITLARSDESLVVLADPDILELAIMNLLDNAAKYSNVPAQITVHPARKAKEAHITISDRGIGIPPSDVEHIFERFYTVNKDRSRRLGGAGLGLSIAKTVIEKHRGTIRVASKVGEGSTFSICLPLNLSH